MEITPNNSWPTEPCWAGWEYNTTEVTSSIVIDVSTQAFSHVDIHATHCSTCTSKSLTLPVTLLIHRLFNDAVLIAEVSNDM
jgi:hypothetical protein